MVGAPPANAEPYDCSEIRLSGRFLGHNAGRRNRDQAIHGATRLPASERRLAHCAGSAGRRPCARKPIRTAAKHCWRGSPRMASLRHHRSHPLRPGSCQFAGIDRPRSSTRQQDRSLIGNRFQLRDQPIDRVGSGALFPAESHG